MPGPVLETVIEHGEAEAVGVVDRTMATLVDEPSYRFWLRGRDVGSTGRACATSTP
jgi:hypothetical protein